MKSYFNAFINVCAVGLILVTGYPAYKVWSINWACESRDDAVGWQDEGYILGPAERVLEQGYFGYRCRELNPPLCYGSTATWIDAIALKTVASSRDTKESIKPMPGAKWFFNADSPERMRVLRLLRLATGFLALIFVGVLALNYRIPILFSILIAIGLTHQLPFRPSCRGLKNDYLALVLMMVWMLGVKAVTWQSSASEKFKSLAGLSVLGVLALGTKFSLFLPLVMWIFSLFIQKRYRAFFFTSFVSGLSYLVLNPNTFVSLSDSTWFLIFTSMVSKPFDPKLAWHEFLWGSLEYGWFAIALLPLWYKEFKEKGLSVFLRRWGLFFVVPIVFSISNTRGSWLRSPYYLPYQGWLLLISIWIWNKHGVKNRVTLASGIISCLLWVIPPTYFTFQGYSFQSEGQNPRVAILDRELNDDRTYDLVLDVSLRAPVREKNESREVVWFDSLSESPFDVSKKISSHGSNVKIIVACFKDTSASPSARLWEKVTNGDCSQRHPLNQDFIFAFENGNKPVFFAKLTLAKLQERLKVIRDELLLPLDLSLSPRMLKGGIEGQDFWFSPLVLFKNTELSGEIDLDPKIRELSIQLESNCKVTSSRLDVRITDQRDHILAENKASLDVSAQTCQHWPLVCKLGLKEWWNKRIPIEPLSLSFDLSEQNRSPTKRVWLKMSALGLAPDRCRLYLQKIQFR